MDTQEATDNNTNGHANAGDNRWLKATEIAARFGITPSRIDQLGRSKKLPRRKVNGIFHYDADAPWSKARRPVTPAVSVKEPQKPKPTRATAPRMSRLDTVKQIGALSALLRRLNDIAHNQEADLEVYDDATCWQLARKALDRCTSEMAKKS